MKMAMMHLMVYHLGIFPPILKEVFQFCIFQFTVNLGSNFSFTLLPSNICIGLDSTSGNSHLLEFLTYVGARIITVQTKSADFLVWNIRRAIKLTKFFSADNHMTKQTEENSFCLVW